MGFIRYLKESREYNEGIVNLGYGYKFIKTECMIVSIILFCVMIFVKEMSFLPSLLVSVATMFIIPQVLLRVRELAYIWTVLFTLLWGYLGYALSNILFNESILAGLVIGFIVGAISFVTHKASLGIDFLTLTALHLQKLQDISDGIRERNDEESGTVIIEESTPKNDVDLSNSETIYEKNKNFKYCENCGKKLHVKAKFCSGCGTEISD